MFIQQIKEGHQVDSLGEILLLFDGEVGKKAKEGVLPLLLRLFAQPWEDSILGEVVS